MNIKYAALEVINTTYVETWNYHISYDVVIAASNGSCLLVTVILGM